MKKIQQHIRAIYTALILKVSGKFFNRHDTRILNSMEDYKVDFDLDSKIAWNRHRLRELFEMYKKIESYYPLFFIFLGFIGLYYFDFIILLINDFNCLFLITFLFTTIALIYNIYNMFNVIFTREWYNDNDPEEIYKKLYNKKTIALPKVEPNCTEKDIIEETKENYLLGLENNVRNNFKTYSNKKVIIKRIILTSFITFLIYSINIIQYKQIIKENMAKTNNDYEGKITNENKVFTFDEYSNKKTTIKITKEQLDTLVRIIVNEELDKRLENKKE